MNRKARPGKHRLEEIFTGIDDSVTLTTLFPRAAARRRFIQGARIVVSPEDLYAYVSDESGDVVLGQKHLQKSDAAVLYLDVLHELVHVQQFHVGRELFDRRYLYVDRPTELEAYALGVREARALGKDDPWIYEYLTVPWVSSEDMRRLAARLGVRALRKR